MLQSSQRAFEALSRIPLFHGLEPSTLQGVADIVETRELARGEVLFEQGEEGNEFFVVQRGSLGLTARADDKPLTLGVLGPGEYLGEMALIDQFPRSASAKALQDSVLLAIRRPAFTELIRGNPDLAMALLQGMARRLRKTNQDAAAIANMSVYRRLARKLLDIASSHGQEVEDGVRLEVPLTVDTLASMIAADLQGVKLLVDLLEHEKVLSRQDDHFVIHKIRPLLDPEFPYKLA
ncbi:MAG: Crp/Fnr family transcriptional regulator [Armatimonadetes bacterium]|nr:Crp/Fnr family transcriptional regulator [Armatimonadota bacterium]